MSSYEQKNGTGTVWKNDKYEVGGNQPYAKGTVIDLDGNKVDIALWIPRSDKVKGFNLTMQPPYKKEDVAEAPEDNSAPTDDLPF